jgi:hypothetical protein
MTISEAMKKSRETGITFRRTGVGYGGWIKYDPNWKYKHLSAEDIMADDWEMDERMFQPAKEKGTRYEK